MSALTIVHIVALVGFIIAVALALIIMVREKRVKPMTFFMNMSVAMFFILFPLKMNKVVKVLIVLILVSVAFYVPGVVNGYEECEGQPDSVSEAEEYRTGHEERGERGEVPSEQEEIKPSPTESGYTYTQPEIQLCCLFATLAGETQTAEKLDVLRDFRDTVLNKNSVGAILVSTYYDVSPAFAEFITEHNTLRTIARLGILEPVIRTLELSGWIWMA
ncbi:MAG: CFI-box-CTERM domain-containing protein [Euryarchaeota archaeon]|nr:CFI-box-CTERM domain-containing protein [Euryarchaeota archaeon]